MTFQSKTHSKCNIAKSITGFALLFAYFILFASIEMPVAEAKQCKRLAEKWSGPCIKTRSCRNSCIHREHALDGVCHFRFPGMACYCYYKC